MSMEGNLMVYKGNKSIENLAEEFELLIKNRIKINGTSTEEVFSKKIKEHDYIWLSNHFVNFTFYFSDDQEREENQEQWAEIYEEEYDVAVDFRIDTDVFEDHYTYLLDVLFGYIQKHRDHDLSLAAIEGTAILVYRNGKLYINPDHSEGYSKIYSFHAFDNFPHFNIVLLQEDIKKDHAQNTDPWTLEKPEE